MKPCSMHLFKRVTMIAIPFVLVGCAYTIKSPDLLPLMQTGSPLKSVSPKAFAFKDFKDVRGTTDPLRIGLPATKLDHPPATIVTKAIKRELERNGHTCMVATAQSKSDFIIEGTVYRYQLAFGHGFMALKAKVIGNVAVKLTISSVPDMRRVLIKNYEGEYYLSGAIVSQYQYGEILNQALLTMIKEISTDPELIALIER